MSEVFYSECRTCGKERRLHSSGDCYPCKAMHEYVPSFYYKCNDCGKIMFSLGWFHDCIYCESDSVTKHANN